MEISWTMPIKTVSEANSSEHWAKKASRHKQQQYFTNLFFQRAVKEFSLPCEITLTRLSPRTLDNDNLLSSLKYIRDEIAACLLPELKVTYVSKGKLIESKGFCDNDPRISWKYDQQKSKLYGVNVKISNKIL